MERFFTIPDREDKITSGESMIKHDSMNVTCKFHHLRQFTEGIDRWRPFTIQTRVELTDGEVFHNSGQGG